MIILVLPTVPLKEGVTINKNVPIVVLSGLE